MSVVSLAQAAVDARKQRMAQAAAESEARSQKQAAFAQAENAKDKAKAEAPRPQAQYRSIDEIRRQYAALRLAGSPATTGKTLLGQ